MSDDVPDVIESLDIARALLAKGDRVEAARFVRRASDAANKAARLIALARAADEIEASSVPPPVRSETRIGSRPALGPFETSRIRVSVRTSARDPALLVVRALRPGERAPAGTHEAHLVMTDAGASR